MMQKWVFISILLIMPSAYAACNTCCNHDPKVSHVTIEYHAKKINLNTANALVLTHSFKGIGAKRAQAIVRERETNGDFKSVADLARVRGISKNFVIKYLEKLNTIYKVD